MTDNTPARKAASLRAVGTSGVVHYGGVLYRDDYDRAFRGLEHDRTIRQMLNDPVVGAVLYAMEMWLRRVRWTVKAKDDSNATAVEYKAFVESCLDDMDGMWPGDTIADLITYLAWGYSLAEIVYKQRIGPYETDPTKRSRFTDGLIGWRRWILLPQTTREGWDFTNGEATAFIQRQQTGPNTHIPLDKCIHLKYQSGNGSPEGRTPLRHAYDAWYFKRNIQRIEAIGIERDLAGLPVMSIPASDIEEQSAVYVAAQGLVTGIRNDTMAGAVISSDVDPETKVPMQKLELLSSGGTRQFDTDVIIRRYSNDVVNGFLAGVLRAGQDGIGTQALSTTTKDLFVTSLSAHLDIQQTAINEQAVIPLMMVNGFDLDFAPTVEHGDIESADIARVGAYLQQLAQSGLLVDTPALRAFVHELAELPVPEEDQLQQEMDAQKVEEQAAKAAELEMQRANLEAARAAQNGKVPA